MLAPFSCLAFRSLSVYRLGGETKGEDHGKRGRKGRAKASDTEG
jgi:hypothetical protein